MIPLGSLLRVARSYVGQQEEPPGSNWGPPDSIARRSLAFVGITGPDSWCAAFVCLCIAEANGGALPRWFTPSAGALQLFARNYAYRVPLRSLAPEDIVIYDHGGGHGHVDIVESTTRVSDADWFAFTTIGGNTSKGGSRQGTGVFDGIYRRSDDKQIHGALRIVGRLEGMT